MFTAPGHRRVALGHRLASHFPTQPDAGPPTRVLPWSGEKEAQKRFLKYEKILNRMSFHLAIPVYGHPVGGLKSCDFYLRSSCWPIEKLRCLFTPL